MGMKTLLSIAESDFSAESGIQADIKISKHFGITCKTAITAICTEEQSNIHMEKLDNTIIEKQLKSIFSNFTIDAIKIGLLPSSSCIGIVREILSSVTVPVLLDPIFMQNDKNFPISEKTIGEISTLFPYTTLITPNVHEAKILFGEKLVINAPCPVLVKNISEKNELDKLFYANNQTVDFSTKFKDLEYKKRNFFSTAIAANLANGIPLEDAISKCYEVL